MERKQVSTIFLRLVIFLIGILALALCIFGLPWIAKEAAKHYPASLLYPVLIIVYVTAVPFYFALYEILKLLNYIDKSKAFSELSVKALKNIKYCAMTISILYVAILPFLFIIADLDDAPGIIIIGLVIVFASSVIATFVAVLEKLLKEAIDIKEDNDLTIWGENNMAIIINIDVMLAKRKMSVTELSERVGITMSNLSILKNGKAKAIRLSTLDAICKALECQPGDILEYESDEK